MNALYQLNAQLEELNRLKTKNKKDNFPLIIGAGVVAVLSLLLCVVFIPAIILTVIAGLAAMIIGLVYVIRDSDYKKKIDKTYSQLYYNTEQSILQTIGISGWKYNLDTPEERVQVKSSQAVEKYDDVKFFKENEGAFDKVANIMKEKDSYCSALRNFLNNNAYKGLSSYPGLSQFIEKNIQNAQAYRVFVYYYSPTGRSQNKKMINISYPRICQLLNDKSILMSKGEYSKYLKEQAKEELEQKQHDYYEKVNRIIDFTNESKAIIVCRPDEDELDKLINSLFDRTINSIKKIKSIDSEEWQMLDDFISGIDSSVDQIVAKNKRINDYYDSEGFKTIKNTCDSLMDSQKEFNNYIEEKVQSISTLFGTKVVRNETVVEDEYNYIHPYKKSITPFTAEVSATVFASAENNPLEYVVKIFYPNKDIYPEQIRKLQSLIAELETLKEAKQIIDNYKKEVEKYLTEVPDYIMEYDEDGFYSRLGFAVINEKTLVVAYKFSYTSGGGKAQRSFTVPMTEETIIKLIEMLESKLTMTAFTKEQRSLMTSKLRQRIKERDDFTCQKCKNSTYKEPNLLLEIDHIIPVSKHGCTVENNLQTLCWKCNREKGANLEQS